MNEETVEIWQLEVRPYFGGMRLYGVAPAHPYKPSEGTVYPSVPASFDEDTDIMTTVSGRKYHINNYKDDKRDEVVAFIKKCIKYDSFYHQGDL